MNLVPGEALRARHRLLRARMEALGAEALVVTNLPNVFYLTNHAGSAGVAVISPHAVTLLVDPRYTEAVKQRQSSAAACPDLRVWDVPGSYDQALVACLRALGVSRAAFEAENLTVARHTWLLKALAEAEVTAALLPTHGLVEEARMIKDAHEQALLRRAAAGLSAVADAGFAAVRPGVTEREVAGAIESAMRRAGYDRVAFDTIVGSGPNGALPHHRAGDRRIVAGDLVVLDFGGVLDGYCSDLTRTVSVGEADAQARRVYRAVLEAQSAGVAAARPGRPASDVDGAARRAMEAHGLAETFTHGTGHGLGLEVHELPRVARPRPDATTPELVLRPGMVFTVEPGAYLPGWGGVRIEDDVLVTEDGCEVLTSVTRELLTL